MNHEEKGDVIKMQIKIKEISKEILKKTVGNATQEVMFITRNSMNVGLVLYR